MTACLVELSDEEIIQRAAPRCADFFWFYGRRLDSQMSADEMAESNYFYARVLDAAGGLASSW